jgi:hypothetical protein
MLIGDIDGMRRATERGCGWRGDCLGDMGGFSKNWNHMDNLYPEHVAKSGAQNAWKRGPVAWESCWEMRKWVREGWNVRRIFDYALDYHASYLNNKSAPLPDGVRPEIERFLRKLGYRLVLRRLEHAPTLTPGSPFTVTLHAENVGVAPPYGDYVWAVRLSDARGKTSAIGTGPTIRGWLPRKRTSVLRLRVPGRLARGRYTLSVGVVEPKTKAPAVRLAIAGRDKTGWYPLSHIEAR